MKILLIIILFFCFGHSVIAQELEFSLYAKASKYSEINSSLGYSFGFNKHLNESGRIKVNILHEMSSNEYIYSGFEIDQGQFSTYIWQGDIFHHNLLMKFQIDLDLTKSKKSNFYIGFNSSLGYSFLKYSGSKHYLEENTLVVQADKKKTVFLLPNIGVNIEYEFAINKNAFAVYIIPTFAIFSNENLRHNENSVFESISAGLVYRFRYKSNDL